VAAAPWRRAPAGRPADLTSIRQTDDLLGGIAAHRITPARADAGARALAWLARDVDTPPVAPDTIMAGLLAPADPGGPSDVIDPDCTAARVLAEFPDRPRGGTGTREWLDTVAAVMIVTLSAAVAAGLVAAGMFTRLGTMAGPRRRPARRRWLAVAAAGGGVCR